MFVRLLRDEFIRRYTLPRLHKYELLYKKVNNDNPRVPRNAAEGDLCLMCYRVKQEGSCPFCSSPTVLLIDKCIDDGKITPEVRALIAQDPAAQIGFEELDMSDDDDDY